MSAAEEYSSQDKIERLIESIQTNRNGAKSFNELTLLEDDITALRHSRDPRGEAVLHSLLSHSEPRIRFEAALSFVEREKTYSLPILLEAFLSERTTQVFVMMTDQLEQMVKLSSAHLTDQDLIEIARAGETERTTWTKTVDDGYLGYDPPKYVAASPRLVQLVHKELARRGVSS